jgi:ribosomal-protein-alanine N-acetyltransferase
LIRAARNDRTALSGMLEAGVPDEWPNPDLAEVLPLFEAQRIENPATAEWSYLLVHRADRLLIGDMGFKGLPDERGTVEIGYGIIPSYRLHGYATEAARVLISWAARQPNVRRIAAECEAGNLASARVLEKVGMQQSGRAGNLLQWELEA